MRKENGGEKKEEDIRKLASFALLNKLCRNSPRARFSCDTFARILGRACYRRVLRKKKEKEPLRPVGFLEHAILAMIPTSAVVVHSDLIADLRAHAMKLALFPSLGTDRFLSRSFIVETLRIDDSSIDTVPDKGVEEREREGGGGGGRRKDEAKDTSQRHIVRNGVCLYIREIVALVIV